MFFTPFTFTPPASNPVVEFWTKAWKDQLGRVDAMQKEMEKVEAQGYERTLEALEESAKLTRESLAYFHKLNAEWRKITLDGLKKSGESFGASA